MLGHGSAVVLKKGEGAENSSKLEHFEHQEALEGASEWPFEDKGMTGRFGGERG